MAKIMEIKVKAYSHWNQGYKEGGGYCPKCNVFFYPDPPNVLLLRCFFCGSPLRKNPRKRKKGERIKPVQRIDPEKYLSE